MAIKEKALEALLEEKRVFNPPEEFVKNANIKDPGIYQEAEKDPEGFWAKHAEKELEWFKKWDKVLEWNPPFAKWFSGGKLNITVNCLDRHVNSWRRNKVAIMWEGEPGDRRVFTYYDLYKEVCKMANVLKKQGVKKGDRVAIYLPMIPEVAIAMLACARMGAPHSVVFGGFSATSLRDRINDAEAKVLITADGSYRRGKATPLKPNADIALQETPSIESCIVVKRTNSEVEMKEGRDYWYHELIAGVSADCPPEIMDAEDTLFILYTSGTTGKPKGIVHTTGGYLLQTHLTCKWVFDMKDEDVFWCTADVGWVTGHSYIVYGPLSVGATEIMYEGTPDYPDKDRFWNIIEKYAVTIFYTAPTAIRTFMRWGEAYPQKHDLSSLRLLGTVGEPINPEAWMWYYSYIGSEKCPIVDTWWQTETGAHMISPLPGITPLKPGSATRGIPGVIADVVDENGNSIDEGGGFLVVKKPWPSMIRTIYGDDERYKDTYWGRFKSLYFAGDGAKKDSDGYIWVLGRIDDVINVSGHRISTMEVESALVEHHLVTEAAVIGKSHDIKGQAISAFVTLKDGVEGSEELVQELRLHVGKIIGPVAKPDDIFFTAELPKTRSGKIMRRLLRDIAEGRAMGDTSTLADPEVVKQLKENYNQDR